VSFEDLQEISSLEQQHPGYSQLGVVLSRFREELSKIPFGKRDGTLAEVEQRKNIATV
jgi:hypothetical protein